MSTAAAPMPAAPPAAAPQPSVSRSATIGVAAFAVSLGVTFVQAPFILRQLGDARYGTWALIGQLTGYYGLLDLGTRSAVSYFVASLRARGQDTEFGRMTASAFWMLGALAGLALLLGAALTALFPSLFDISGLSRGEVTGAVALASLAMALTLPFDVFAAVVVGCRRPEAINTAEVVVRLANAAAIFVVLARGGGLVALAALQLASKAAVWGTAAVLARREAPALRMSPRLVTRRWVREIAGYGTRNAVINVAQLVIYRVDTVIVGAALGPRFVTFYTLGQMMTTYVSQIVGVVTRTFTPHFAHAAALEDEDGLRRLYLTGSRLAGALVALTIAYMAAFGSSFLRLWVGPEYVRGPLTARSDVVMVLLLAALLPRMLQSISWQLLFGTRRVDYLMRLQLWEAGANLALSVALVQVFGLVGVALGTVVPAVVGSVVFLPRYVLRTYRIPLRSYLAEGIGRPVAVGAVALVVSAAVTWGMPPAGWGMFVAEAAACGALGVVLAWTVVLTSAERSLVRRRLRLGRAA